MLEVGLDSEESHLPLPFCELSQFPATVRMDCTKSQADSKDVDAGERASKTVSQVRQEGMYPT